MLAFLNFKANHFPSRNGGIEAQRQILFLAGLQQTFNEYNQ
jgi:hypothetical protein